MYKVIKAFTDLQDGNYVYHSGDIFPRNGAKVSQKRIDELSGTANRLGYPLIAVIKGYEPDGEPVEEKPVKKAIRGRKKAE